MDKNSRNLNVERYTVLAFLLIEDPGIVEKTIVIRQFA
jgi:hypothetical protein